MPESSQYDVRELENLALPYDVTTKELDPRPRLVDGLNMYVTPGGKLARRPGFHTYGSTTDTIDPDYRVERINILRSVGDEYHHILMNVRDMTASSPAYRQLRANPAGLDIINASTYNSTELQETLINAGRAYTRLKADGIFADNYNAVMNTIDAATGAVYEFPWGLPKSPTAVPTITVSVSANPVTVRVGWKYAYAYVSATGHIGNRSSWVDSGPRTDVSIGVAITPYSDIITYPQIAIYRTSDGGGLFTEVGRVVNTGFALVWWDGAAAAGTGDPRADSTLDFSNIAPDEVINSGPPARNYPNVYPTSPVGTYSNLAYFARRIWYAVENRVYFSGQEEIYNGVPEECFPDPDGVRGNWYILPHDVVSLCATQDRLFIHTTDDIYVVRGEDRVNLRLMNYTRGLGMPSGMKVATCAYRDTEFFVSKDWQVYAIAGDNPPVPLSVPIASALKTIALTTDDIQLVVWSQQGVQWLVVAMINHIDPEDTRLFVYDLDRGFWFTPWAVRATAITTGKLAQFDERNHLIVAVKAEDDNTYITFCRLDEAYDTMGPDVDGITSVTGTATTSLLDLPAGNHVNLLRQPGHHPMLSYIKLEHLEGAAETLPYTAAGEPTLQYRLDEVSGSWTTGTSYAPPFMSQRSSYKTRWYPIQQVVQRVQIKVTYTGTTGLGDIQTLGLIFTPEAGA
jgi:hypothetical protein